MIQFPLCVIPNGFQPERLEALHQSAVGDYLKCKRYFLLKHLLGLRRRGGVRSPALDIGTFMHEHLYSALAKQPSRVVDKVDEITQAILEEMPAELQAKELTKLKDNEALGHAMADAMLEMFPIESDKLKVLAVEKLVSTNTLNMHGWHVGGTLDVLMQEPNGNIWVVDHKTARNPEHRAQTCSFELQGRLYGGLACALLSRTQTLLATAPVVGVIHNIIQKPTIKYCSKDANYEAYVERVKAWYREKRENHLKFPDTTEDVVVRSFVRFPQPMIPCRVAPANGKSGPKAYRMDGKKVLSGEMLEVLRQIRRDVKSKRQSLAVWPKDISGKACGMFNRSCEYLPLCARDEAAWGAAIGEREMFNIDLLSEEDEDVDD